MNKPIKVIIYNSIFFVFQTLSMYILFILGGSHPELDEWGFSDFCEQDFSTMLHGYSYRKVFYFLVLISFVFINMWIFDFKKKGNLFKKLALITAFFGSGFGRILDVVVIVFCRFLIKQLCL